MAGDDYKTSANRPRPNSRNPTDGKTTTALLGGSLRKNTLDFILRNPSKVSNYQISEAAKHLLWSFS